MRQIHFPNLTPRGERIKKSRAVVLTDRDLLIIEYILDMKFASIQNIFEKFFKVTFSGDLAKSNEWTVRRLQQLVSAGYLLKTHSFTERENYYLATLKGFRAVKDSKPELEILRPSLTIDHNTFTHDKLVLEARIALENHRAANSWMSDKKLRSASDLAGGLKGTNVPDGIYLNASGTRIALEMELNFKTKAIYKEKIRRYVMMMRSSDPKVNVFDKVVYLCSKETIFNYLSAETRIYTDLFEIHNLSDFLDRVRATDGLAPRLEEPNLRR